MPHGVMDEVFGKIQWSEDQWETTASIEYFRGSGERVPLTEKDWASMPSVDRLEMDIQTGEKRRKPDERQREAWKKILERGDALWDEALDAMIVEYRRQWPMRARYWRVSADMALMERVLPERVDRETMRQMVVPFSCTLEWPDARDGAVDFFLVFAVGWYAEPLSVYVRDGRVSDVVPMSVFLSRRALTLRARCSGQSTGARATRCRGRATPK